MCTLVKLIVMQQKRSHRKTLLMGHIVHIHSTDWWVGVRQCTFECISLVSEVCMVGSGVVFVRVTSAIRHTVGQVLIIHTTEQDKVITL